MKISKRHSKCLPDMQGSERSFLIEKTGENREKERRDPEASDRTGNIGNLKLLRVLLAPKTQRTVELEKLQFFGRTMNTLI